MLIPVVLMLQIRSMGWTIVLCGTPLISVDVQVYSCIFNCRIKAWHCKGITCHICWILWKPGLGCTQLSLIFLVGSVHTFPCLLNFTLNTRFVRTEDQSETQENPTRFVSFKYWNPTTKEWHFHASLVLQSSIHYNYAFQHHKNLCRARVPESSVGSCRYIWGDRWN